MKQTYILFFLIASQSIYAQLTMSFYTGYAIPTYNKNKEDLKFNNIFSDNYLTITNGIVTNSRRISRNVNPAKGFFNNIVIGYQFKHWGLSLNTSFLYNKNKSYNNFNSNVVYYDYLYRLDSLSTKHDNIFVLSNLYVKLITFSPEINFKIKIHKFTIEPSGSLNINFISIYQTEKTFANSTYNYIFSDSLIMQTNSYSKEMRYVYTLKKPKMWFNYGISMFYRLSNKYELSFSAKYYNLKCEVSYPDINSTQTYCELTKADGSQTISNEKIKVDKNLGVAYLSNWRISVGVRYTLGKKE